jgi:hypothetical protein
MAGANTEPVREIIDRAGVEGARFDEVQRATNCRPGAIPGRVADIINENYLFDIYLQI